jgi:hypothetical protein
MSRQEPGSLWVESQFQDSSIARPRGETPHAVGRDCNPNHNAHSFRGGIVDSMPTATVPIFSPSFS